MPRKKTSDAGFTWDGKRVSKTTYFRRKAEQKMMGVSEEDLVRLPKPGVPQALSEPPTPAEQTTTASVGEHVDDALLRDFMAITRSMPPGQIRFDVQVAVPPRAFFAIVRALEKAGY